LPNTFWGEFCEGFMTIPEGSVAGSSSE
jgi:hypothetical protein